jgi:hypothetical protein
MMRRHLPALVAALTSACLVPIEDTKQSDGSGGAAGAGGNAGVSGVGGSSASSGSSGASGGGGSSGASGSGGSSGTGGSGEGGSAGEGGGAGAGGAGGESPIFFDDFSGDLSKWQSAGDGNWISDSGFVVQTSSNASGPILYAVGQSESAVRLVAKARRLLIGDPNGAVELMTHYNAVGHNYHCNWETDARRLLLKAWNGIASAVVAQKTVDPAQGYDPTATVTLELTVAAGKMHCRVLEVPGADIEAPAVPALGPGSFGLRTWRMSASFDDFAAYAVP